ncbi:putative E3 ubiquitin-protein ligase HERC6 [Porphyridium purpureum]|uniref:Putative E3 ubiquitin-protein ligase HERC6 n=1 Tax=Porphyridium purpureum TaxID=35688 RepID=A0A5J4Z7D7_PORPP|nr:putative E3 ubiquitin-protein ligase HERC6 [Porphyridium purpureum]|eukprot:POR4759..scf295_1
MGVWNWLFGRGDLESAAATQVWVWGFGSRKHRQVLDGVPPDDAVRKVAVGQAHVVGLTAAGNMYVQSIPKEASGSDLGTSTPACRKVDIGRTVVDVAVTGMDPQNEQIVAVLKNGSVVQHSLSDKSKQGDASVAASQTHQTLRGALQSIHAVQVNCSRSHCVSVGSKGQLVSWSNVDKEEAVKALYPSLGRGALSEKSPPVSEPQLMELPAGIKAERASCGLEHTGIVDQHGALWMCGRNTWGQLARPPWNAAPDLEDSPEMQKHFSKSLAQWYTFENYRAPSAALMSKSSRVNLDFVPRQVEHPFLRSAVVDVALGDHHTLVMRADGSVVSFGLNQWGACAHHNYTHIVEPALIERLDEGAESTTSSASVAERAFTEVRPVHIAASGNHSLVWGKISPGLFDGIWSFGENRDFELGIATRQHACVPQRIRADWTGARVLSMVAGLRGGVAVLERRNNEQNTKTNQ